MGVTLERVQNKFACIIGELCSEPLILSQFAIWVDLRIAEYKAKGAISLDCSGEKPSPTWLKGIQPVPGEENPSGIRRGISPGRHKAHNYGNNESVSSVTFDEVPLDSNRLVVEDAFAVKQEQLCRDDEVFPIGVIHPHQSSAQRKRTMEEERDFLYSDNSIFPSGSPEKCRRLSSDKITNVTPEHENSTTNQSLMSVISAQDLPSVSSTRLNEDSQTLDYDRGDNSSNIPYIGESATPPHSHSASQASYQTAHVGRWIPKEYGNFNSKKGLKSQAASLFVGSPKETRTPSGISGVSKSMLTSAGAIDCKESFPMSSQQAGESWSTMRNTLYAVRTFEKWLISKKGVASKMEKIEPSLLDQYLVEFFNTAKRPSGEDYRHGSIRLLRERFERYLKLNGYPYSLVSSSVFHNSQLAFRERKKYLKMLETMQGNVIEESFAGGLKD